MRWCCTAVICFEGDILDVLAPFSGSLQLVTVCSQGGDDRAGHKSEPHNVEPSQRPDHQGVCAELCRLRAME